LGVFHGISHKQKLPISQIAQPHPLIGANQIRGLVGVQTQMLFQEAKAMLDGKAPKIHAAQVFQ